MVTRGEASSACARAVNLGLDGPDSDAAMDGARGGPAPAAAWARADAAAAAAAAMRSRSSRVGAGRMGRGPRRGGGGGREGVVVGSMMATRRRSGIRPGVRGRRDPRRRHGVVV